MQDIIIDEEFKWLLPALDAETYKLLEENILENGCRDSLILWGITLIDGHNRYAICMEHDIPFNTVSKDFDTREDVLIWIITTQVARRNLSPRQLSYYRGRHYRADKQNEGNKSGRNQHSEELTQNGEVPKAQSTVSRLAGQYNVSKNTIARDAKAADALDAIGEASAEAKRMYLSGEVAIDKQELERLATVSEEEIYEIAASIVDGTYEKTKPEKPDADIPTTEKPPAQESGYSGDGVYADGVFGGGISVGVPPDVSAGAQPLDMVLSKISGDAAYYSALRSRAVAEGTPELKRALRSYIDILEELFGLILA